MRKITTVAAAAAALMALAVPTASAQPVPPVGDTSGCTTVLLDESQTWVPTHMPNNWVEVTYTPPTTVTVSADRGYNYLSGIAFNITGDVVAFVDCVV
ncbi:MAG TPA: hypothetical protein VEV43_02690 [Actinomycetota bacterium]|nr:hypothetical protein [Actinomycetota bacterium]